MNSREQIFVTPEILKTVPDENDFLYRWMKNKFPKGANLSEVWETCPEKSYKMTILRYLLPLDRLIDMCLDFAELACRLEVKNGTTEFCNYININRENVGLFAKSAIETKEHPRIAYVLMMAYSATCKMSEGAVRSAVYSVIVSAVNYQNRGPAYDEGLDICRKYI